MPAHIYLRTGRYQDAVSASVIAIRSDRLYEEKCLVPYVPLHNIAMLVSASLFCGNFIQALKYSPYSSLSLPEASAIHLPALIPTPKDVIMTRMGRWTDILSIFADNSEIKNNSLSTRNPRAIKFIKYASINKDKSELFIERERGKRKSLRSNTNQIGNEKGMNLDSINRKTFGTSTDSPYVRAMQAYSQTLAYSGTGDLRRAGNFLDILSESVKSIPYDNLPLDHPFYPYHHEISEILLLIARSSLILKENINRGESLDSSILLMKEAVGLQDSFSYMEPESFHFPVRHCLGALLIERSKLEIQEKVTTLQGQGEEQGQRQRQRGGAKGAQLDSDTELLVVAGLELESAVGHTVSLLEAIDVYRTDLEDHPRNIWSLRGLLLAYQSLQQIRLRNTTESVTQTKEQIMMAVKREEEKDDGELFVHIATLKAIERDAFASTDHDYMKITGSCCELSLC